MDLFMHTAASPRLFEAAVEAEAVLKLLRKNTTAS
jgi:hypothetical protein